jgi:hypothetical protein
MTQVGSELNSGAPKKLDQNLVFFRFDLTVSAIDP